VLSDATGVVGRAALAHARGDRQTRWATSTSSCRKRGVKRWVGRLCFCGAVASDAAGVWQGWRSVAERHEGHAGGPAAVPGDAEKVRAQRAVGGMCSGGAQFSFALEYGAGMHGPLREAEAARGGVCRAGASFQPPFRLLADLFVELCDGDDGRWEDAEAARGGDGSRC